MGNCIWAYVNDRERHYHDTEWGVPVHDDRHMFEHLTLESLQCGLSWDLMRVDCFALLRYIFFREMKICTKYFFTEIETASLLFMNI